MKPVSRRVLSVCIVGLGACLTGAILLGGCGEERGPEQVSRTLPNGVRLLVRENRASEVVAVQAWVADGALYETPDEAGLAYLLSQMMFTKTSDRELGAVPREIESLGGSTVVNPRHDFIEYAAVAPSEHLDVLVDIMADGLLNAIFDSLYFEDMKEDALSHIESIGQRPMERAHQMCISDLLGGHPYGRPVQGTSESLSRLTLANVRDRYRRVYNGANLLVSIAGDVEPMETADLVEERLAGIEPGEPAAPAAASVDWPDVRSRVVRTADVRTAYQVMCFPAPSIVDEENITMDVLLMVLTGGRSSRLERALSEERQLATGVEAGWYTLRQPSPLFVWMELPPDNVEAAEEAVASLFMDLAEAEVSPEELSKAKTYWKTQVYFLNETSEGQAFYDAYWTFLGWPELPQEYLESIDRVTTDEVRRAAEKYFGTGAYATSVLLPEWAGEQ